MLYHHHSHNSPNMSIQVTILALDTMKWQLADLKKYTRLHSCVSENMTYDRLEYIIDVMLT